LRDKKILLGININKRPQATFFKGDCTMTDALKELLKKRKQEEPKPKRLWSGEEYSEIEKLIRKIAGDKIDERKN
jgi:hypothetical protein